MYTYISKQSLTIDERSTLDSIPNFLELIDQPSLLLHFEVSENLASSCLYLAAKNTIVIQRSLLSQDLSLFASSVLFEVARAITGSQDNTELLMNITQMLGVVATNALTLKLQLQVDCKGLKEQESPNKKQKMQ